MKTFDKYPPLKSKILRVNDAPYMTKIVRKALFRGLGLENKFYKNNTGKYLRNYKTHKN